MFKQFFRNKNTKWVLLIVFVFALALSDYFLHGYYNIEGYRGDSLGDKKVGEYRIACFGGSTTFGFGGPADASWPQQLQALLRASNNFSVVNLGANNQGIYGINYDVQHYSYLNYDMAILYNGETDRSPDVLSTLNFRGDDVFCEYFGYKTMLGFYIKEALRRLTPVAKEERKLVFDASVKTDSSEANVSSYYQAFNNRAIALLDSGKTPYAAYIAQMEEVLNYLVTRKIRTVVVCQPGAYESVQQHCVRDLLHRKFEGLVQYVNLSELFPSMQLVSIDGMHLTASGNKRVALALRDSLFAGIH
jgi:lysophospholipase L1-like esterase